MPVSLLLIHFKLKLSYSVNPVWISLFAWLFVVVVLFCFLNTDCSDCMMLALSRYTHLCLHPLHFLPVLWLTADNGIKRDILGLEQRNRSTSLLEKDVPFRIRLEYFKQSQQTRGQLLTFCIDIWEIFTLKNFGWWKPGTFLPCSRLLSSDLGIFMFSTQCSRTQCQNRLGFLIYFILLPCCISFIFTTQFDLFHLFFLFLMQVDDIFTLQNRCLHCLSFLCNSETVWFCLCLGAKIPFNSLICLQRGPA